MAHYGSVIPEHVAARLRGGQAFRERRYAVPIISLGEDGWPHVAMVSGVCLTTGGEVRFPLRRRSTTWRNLERDGRVTVIVAIDGLCCYIKGETGLEPAEDLSEHYGVVAIRPTDVREDASPAFHVEGLTFRSLHDDPGEVEERRVFGIICGRP